MVAASAGAAAGDGLVLEVPATEVALLTGGWDRPYAYGLTTALDALGVRVDAIVGPDLDAGEFDSARNVTVFNLRKEQRADASRIQKALGILRYYGRLVRYAWNAKPKIFHVLWNN